MNYRFPELFFSKIRFLDSPNHSQSLMDEFRKIKFFQIKIYPHNSVKNSMLLYKVILTRKDQKEILYQSISSKVKLPPLELCKSEVGAMLVITTCDSSTLDDEEVKIYHSGASKLPAVA